MQHVYPVDYSKFPDGFHSEVIVGPKNGFGCYVMCTRVPSGFGGPPLHTHPADQLYYVMSGTMNLQLGTDRFVVQPDTLVLIPEGVPHRNWNTEGVPELHFEVIVPAPPMEKVVVPAEPREVPNAGSLVRPLKRDAFQVRGGFSYQFLATRDTGSGRAALHSDELQPGSGGPSLHIHGFDQFYFIMQGEMNFQIGLNQYSAGANSLVILPGGVVHRNWNPGPGLERHIVLLMPEPKPGEIWDPAVDIHLKREA